MTIVYATADIIEKKNNSIFSTTSSQFLATMFHMPIWINKQFILMGTSEALVHAACFVPFMSIKGPVGQKTSTEVVIILIMGFCGLFAGRGLGHLLHERSLKGVPLYTVSLSLMANGLSLIMCALTINNFAIMFLYFGLFEFFFEYYKSIQNIVLVSVFPVRKFNNVCGQISLVLGISSFAGILTGGTQVFF